MTVLVDLTEVRKLYNGGSPQAAVDGVTLTVQQGEFTAVMGPSGSGKSTLLNLIAGLDRPSQGRVLVDGVDVGSLNETELARFRRTRIGFIFQFFNLLNNLTVLDNILIPAQLAAVSPAVARDRATDLMNELGLAEKQRLFPGRLSGGERQRVAIARALINQPLLLLADEPTGALDSRAGEQVMGRLTELNRRGQTILLVTHDAKLAAAYASRVITLSDGRVADDSRLEASPEVAASDIVRLRSGEAAP
jgi:putative ABC transport system ATP-binding protein